MQYIPERVSSPSSSACAAAAGSAYAQDTTETGQAAIDTTVPAEDMIDTTAIDTTAIDTTAVDTSAARDTTDTSGVQNPPGYRGMERDTTIFPDAGGPPASAERGRGSDHRHLQ